MNILVGFVSVLLIAALAGGLIYTIVKRKLVPAILLAVGVLIVGGLWWWLSSTPTPSAATGTSSGPGTWSSLLQFTPKGVWQFFRDYWFWVSLILAGLFFGFGAAAKSKPWAKAVQGMVILIAITLAGAMAVHGIWGESSSSQQVQKIASQGCTSASPCTLALKNGSTDRTNIPQGKSVCFEPFFWNNIQQFGYKTSYKGGPEGGTGVSADTFWFVPEAGINVPRYWFIQEGSTHC